MIVPVEVDTHQHGFFARVMEVGNGSWEDVFKVENEKRATLILLSYVMLVGGRVPAKNPYEASLSIGILGGATSQVISNLHN